MTIIIENATKEEALAIKKILAKTTVATSDEVNQIEKTISELDKCKNCDEVIQARNALRPLRSSMVKALEAFKNAIILTDPAK